MTSAKYVRWFEELTLEDVPLVGGKNASLGELYQRLTPLGVKVPNGFAVTAEAYQEMLSTAGVWKELHALLDDLNKEDVSELARRGARARELVYGAGLPDQLRSEILEAYKQLQSAYGADLSLAVRSSATAEDLPTASFAGQHDTFLNVSGEEMLLDSCRRCFASLFTDRAISYRIDNGFDHFKVSLSIGIMKMVRSDVGSAGVMFSIDTETGFPDAVFITGAYGLGETVVQGLVDPDEYYVHKPTYKEGFRTVLRRVLGEKQVKLVYARGGARESTRLVPTQDADRARLCLQDEDVLTLAGHAIAIGEHYSARAGHEMPMDIEWAKDGLDGELYIVQARPETVASQRKGQTLTTYELRGEAPVIITGRAVGTAIASGTCTDYHGRPSSKRLQAGRGSGSRHDRSGLGTDYEDGLRDRHEPGGADMPCGHRCAGAWHPGCRRHGRGDKIHRNRDRLDGLVRGGRHRPCLSRTDPV